MYNERAILFRSVIMKKLFLCFISIIACIGSAGCTRDKNELVIATVEISGNFINGFGGSDYDEDIKRMIHGYSTYDYDEYGNWKLNEVPITSVERVVDDMSGNVTYTFTVREELKWSDGHPLTAKDYVFSVLFSTSDEWVSVGAADPSYEHLLGYYTYNKGIAENGVEQIIYAKEQDPELRAQYEAEGKIFDHDGYALDEYGQRIPIAGVEVDENGFPLRNEDGTWKSLPREEPGENGILTGIQLLDPTTFSITIDGQALPYFQESILATIDPVPMHIYTQGKGDIESGKGGSKVIGCDLMDVAEFVKNTYRKNPSVTCGPYTFVSYENKMVKLKLNKEFLGDFRGYKPEIESIVVKELDPMQHVDALLAGTVDLVTGIVDGGEIKKVINNSNIASQQYYHNGYGTLSFATDFGPVKEASVRRAIAYSIDKTELIQTGLDGYGEMIRGDYSYAQWMYHENKEQINSQLEAYDYNLQKANEELDKSSYKYEADGVTPFDVTKVNEEGTYLRYNAQKEPLVIRHLGTQASKITDAIELQFMKNFKKLGIAFTVEKSDFATLLTHYYNGSKLPQGERRYHSFNLATVLSFDYNPYYASFHSAFAGSGMNPTGIKDKKLDYYMEQMLRLRPDQEEEYMQAWLEYQKRFNEILPLIPLYTNMNYDFYTNRLTGVNVNAMESYGHIISQLRWVKE